MKVVNQRQLRVGQSIRHALSEILSRADFLHPDLVGVSVTVCEVRVSPDLRHAIVFIMPLGGENQDTIINALNEKAGFIRKELSYRIETKFLPALKFLIDTTFEEVRKLENLLKNPKVACDLAKTPTV